MVNTGPVKVGIIGSGFEADLHAAAFQVAPHEAQVVACASPTPGNAATPAPQDARCVRGKEATQATGEDKVVVMEASYAGYASAGKGRKKELPFRAPGAKRPVDLWLNGSARRGPLQQ